MIYDQADYFRIPLLDGNFGVGQVFEKAAGAPDVIFCGISLQKSNAISQISPLKLTNIIAVVRIHDPVLTSEQWPLAGFNQIPRFRSFINYEGCAALGFPDHPVHDPAVIEAFTNAIHGLYPWTAFGTLFDQIKRPDMDKPSTAT